MHQGPPYFYDHVNLHDALDGSSIRAHDTRVTRYFQRYLLQKAISVFRWTIPEGWAENFLLYCLYCWGYVAVFETDKFGVIFQPCGLRGYDVFYRPTNAVIANPLIKGRPEPRIGKQCELLRLQPDYGGVMDIVTHYAELMAIATETAAVNLFNSKLAYVFLANGKAGAETFKKLYDKILSGEPAAVIDKLNANPDGTPPWTLFLQNVGQNYITSDVLADMRKLENMFDTDIGIPNANTDKRERVIRDEVNANNIETLSKCSLWLQTLQEDCRKINAMFGPKLSRPLSVEWRYPVTEAQHDKGGASNAGNTVNSGAV